MPVIYFDNFRGFEKTFLPLEKVNFLIGENSTGKTSILKLIKIVSNPRFWIFQDFNSDEVELGYFNELVSYGSKKKSFEIGVLGDNVDKEKGISAMKFKFTEKEGQPLLSELWMIDKKINIQASVKEGVVKYRYEKVDLDLITEENKLRYFKIWIEKNGLKGKNYHRNKFSSPMFHNSLLFQIQAIIETKIQKTKKEEEIHSFNVPSFLQDIAWLAPIRTEPKRTYDSYKISFSPDGTHAPYLLKNLLSSSKNKNKVKSILEKFGSDSGLFDKIAINNLGKSSTSPFEIHVYFGNKPLKITNVGYGVSQILPVVIEVIARRDGTWFAIQQPEIHLHPKGQAAFGDFVIKSLIEESKNFIIETHSDFLVDRFRIKKSKYNKDKSSDYLNSQIVFFKRTETGNELACIPIDKNGEYPDDQPKEFRDFFIKEQLELLNL